MRKCKCGTSVQPSDPNSVVRKDRSGKIIEVICGKCASGTHPRRRDYRKGKKSKWGSWSVSPCKAGYDEG